MKTACLARTAATDAPRGGRAQRKPFFSAINLKGDDPVQARLRVGAPGDRYEVEADRTADRVVNGERTGLLAQGVSRIVQRAEADVEQDEPELQKKGTKEEEEEVRAKAAGETEEELAQAQGPAPEEVPQAKALEEEEPAVQRAAEEDEEDVEVQRSVAEREEKEPEVQRDAAETEAEEEKLQRQDAGEQDEREELRRKAAPHEPGSEGEVRAKAEPEEEEVQAKAAPDEEKEELQARASDAATPPVSEDLSRQIRASRGLGNPLPGDVRERMSEAFGADVSGVRIHTDAPAVLLARSLKAQAFTVGSDIFFGEGKFSPGSREGEHLLAHELTHTIQQGAVEPDSDASTVIRLAPEPSADEESYGVRPEIVEAIRLARGEIGKVNAKKLGGDGKRIGWERLREYFGTAFGGTVVSEAVIDKIVIAEVGPNKERKDALPSWCGIFTWWAMKKAGIPIPDWKLGAPALDAMKPRPAGSLPRKGDIAIDVVPNNHFAMVTGLESTKDAEGKPTKMTRVATVNGNTAGEDNLGGQVQERWDTVSRWDHFLDPVGKMNLPEVPLVTVSREPSEAEAAGEGPVPQKAEAGPSPAAQAAEATDAALKDLDEDVPPPAGDMFGEAPPEADLSLPPPADAGPAEEVAVVETVELGGSSDEATVAFIDASPSSMAVTQPAFGPAVDARMKGEQQDIVDNPPVLEAKTSGAVDVPLQSPDQIPIPTDTSLDDGATAGGGDLDKVSGADPGPFRGNADRDKQLQEEDSGSFFDRFMKFIRSFIKGVRTKDDSIDTSAGERPSVNLAEDADPSNMATDREKGTSDLRKQRDAQVEAFKNHPGQSNIQPRMVDESRPAPVKAEPTAEIEGRDDEAVRDFAAAPLPADVRAKADAKLTEQMAPELAEARTQTVDAATTRDTDKETEIDTAQREAAKINEGADSDQRKIVIDNRGEVAKLQGEGIGTAYDHVNDFAKDAATEQGKNRKEIGDHVKTEQGKAKKKLEEGEKEAEDKKAAGEKEAEEKKEELERQEKDDGWWGWVKDKIKKAVKVITDAIDKVFTAVRKAVKEIIERVKNAAIDLINKARNWVVDKIDKFRNWAKDKVDKYLKDSFPGLAKRINDGIDSFADTAIEGVNYVADKAIEGITKLADSLAAALDKILATFQTALKTAVRVVGAIMQGDFAEALRAAIEGACEIAGIDSKPIFEFLDRAGKAIASILKDPVGFIKKLFGAVGDGLSNFFKNIKKHLIQGVIGWLTGALSEVNLTGPFEFTPKGILRIVLEILGLTYANIKARVIRKLPAAAKVFDAVETGFALVKRLITEGPSALWEEIKERVSTIKETVMGAIRSWLITTVIKEGIIWLLSLTNPASAIVKAVKLLFDLVMFLVERYQQIKDFILSVYEAVAAIAAGNFTKVVTAVEDALARVLPVLISLLASLIGLGGIAKQVKKVIETITKPINKAIDWVVDKIVKFAKKIIAKVKAGAKKAKEKAKETIEKIATWWKERRKFKSKDGGTHSIYYAGEAKAAHLMIASEPDEIENFLAAKKKDKNAPADQKQVAKEAAAQYKKVLDCEDKLEKLRAARAKVSTSDKAAYRAATSAVNSEIRVFRNELDALSKILQRATFETEDSALVRTYVSHDAGGDKSTKALPLTYLSGNTKGSSPGQDPPQWKHAVDLDTKPDGSSMNMWVRGHLLNDNLHGPGTAPNLVPITQTMNRKMEADVERPAKAAIKERGKLFFYQAVVTYWKKPSPIDVFPQKIVVTWGEAKRDESDSTKFAPAKANPPVTIEMATAPPQVATAFVPSINGGSPLLLYNAIKKHDAAVTTYYVSQVLLVDFEDNGRFTSKTNMKKRLWDDVKTDLRQKKGDTVADNRRRYVDATYSAITAGDAQV